MMKQRRYIAIFSCLCFVLLQVTACAQGGLSSSKTSPASSHQTTTQPVPARTIPGGHVYVDAKLGFQITLPQNWQAQPQPGSQASSGNAAVTFTDPTQSMDALILMGVFHGSSMPAAFAQRGTPDARIGSYPAFIADRDLSEARSPCLVRIFLAGNDYVMADWCAPDAFSHKAQFEQVLATYQPAPPKFSSRSTTAPQPQTCDDMQHLLGYSQAAWGEQLATPVAAGWGQMQPGLFICSNEGSSDWFLFQCTELVNRLIYERWALPHIPGNAARYLDYYQDGTLYSGTIRTFPAGSYQISDDASQGNSSFRPVAGDLLIFQDVNDSQVGWTSGLTSSPGHVAAIVGVDDQYVYVAQENYNDTQYFLALPIHQVANGYTITDLSGWNQRIVRGWIHFTANGGALPTM